MLNRSTPLIDMSPRCLGRPSLDQIRLVFEAEFGELMFRGPRTRALAERRFAFYWVARTFGHTSSAVAVWAHVDRTTVRHGWARARELIDTEPQWKADVMSLVGQIKGPQL